MSAPSSRERTRATPPTPAAATVNGGSAKARPVQNASRQLHLSKELFFAGFPCQRAYQRTNTAPTSPDPSVRPLSKKFVRGFFQQYGAVDAFFYDETRGMGSVVFADGADAESCYLAVHLSFLPATTAEGGIGQPTWEQDTQGEDMAARAARPADLLLCLEFAHCCPFVHPVLLTRDVFLDGGSAHCEVPGAALSRAMLFHRFPQLLATSAAGTAPVAPRVVARWGAAKDAATSDASRVEVVDDDDEDKGNEGKEKMAASGTTPSLVLEGPFFPGRGIEPVEVEEALWRLLRPAHIPPATAAGTDAVTVLDLWWEYFNVYMVHKTQPSEARVGDGAYRYAQRPSLFQEMLQLQRAGREYAHGDEAAAQQVLQRLVHDHQFHNIHSYLLVKQQFKYDPVWASLMRDVYRPKVLLQLEAWQALAEQTEKEASEGKSTTSATAASTAAADPEARRRRVVLKAIKELHHPQPTKTQDIEWVRRAEELWFTLPRTVATANLMENVKFLGKVKRGEVDRKGRDKELVKRPALPTESGTAENGETDMAAAYPSMNARQRDEQFYGEVMQNVDGYVADGTAEEMVSLCEDPKLFRYAKGHLGYEEAHQQPSYWLAYLNALWVPLIALFLLGYGSYYIVDRLGISKVNEKLQQEQQRREFHDHLRQFLDQQQRMMDGSLDAGSAMEKRAAMRKMNETMQKASEAAQKAGGRFNIELRGDL